MTDHVDPAIADGAIDIVQGSETDRAISNLFAGTLFGEKWAPVEPLRLRILSRRECRARYRKRVLLPMILFFGVLPAAIVVVSVLGAILRGQLDSRIEDLSILTALLAMGFGFALLLTYPYFQRDYRKRVEESDDRTLVVDLGIDNVVARDGTTVLLAGRWARLRVTNLEPYLYPGRHQRWLLEAITLGDPEGRELRLSRYTLEDGEEAFRAIVQRMSEAGRLRLLGG